MDSNTAEVTIDMISSVRHAATAREIRDACVRRKVEELETARRLDTRTTVFFALGSGLIAAILSHATAASEGRMLLGALALALCSAGLICCAISLFLRRAAAMDSAEVLFYEPVLHMEESEDAVRVYALAIACNAFNCAKQLSRISACRGSWLRFGMPLLTLGAAFALSQLGWIAFGR